MQTVTLNTLKAEQDKLAKMIAAFEYQEKSTYFLPEANIVLNPGEVYAGIILGQNAEQDYHLILLPGQAEKVSWGDAKDFAKTQGGELPTRREQSLLFANLKDEFSDNWYWSSDTSSLDSDFAWVQYFNDGEQNNYHENYTYRARAVRRVVI